MGGKGLKIGLSALCLLVAVAVYTMTREPADESFVVEPASSERVEEAAEKEWENKKVEKKKAAPSKRIREDIG